MSIITDDYTGVSVMVFADKVCSKLEEDRGIPPTLPWNMYTFMNLMKNAGYEMEKTMPGSTVALFENVGNRYICASCLNDCKYTGTIVDVPMKVADENFFMSVRMCITCSKQFRKEYNALMDFTTDKPEQEKPKEEHKKVGFWKRLFGMAGK